MVTAAEILGAVGAFALPPMPPHGERHRPNVAGHDGSGRDGSASSPPSPGLLRRLRPHPADRRRPDPQLPVRRRRDRPAGPAARRRDDEEIAEAWRGACGQAAGPRHRRSRVPAAGAADERDRGLRVVERCVTVRYFAGASAAAGLEEELVEVPDAATVEVLAGVLAERTPGFKERSTLTKRSSHSGRPCSRSLAAAVVGAVGHVAGCGEVEQHVQGRVDLRRPAQRRRLVAGPRPGLPRSVQKALGSKVQTTFKENVPEGPQVAQVIDAWSATATTSSSRLVRVPARDGSRGGGVPRRHLRVGDGHDPADEHGRYYGAGEDANYLAGIAAGAATKSGIIGYVVPFAIPEVIRHMNAFALGAQARTRAPRSS